MKRYWIILMLALTVGPLWSQRQSLTSQYLIHPVLVNPAAITIRPGMNGAFIFQKQWVGFENAPTSIYANFNAPLLDEDHFIGGTLISDQVGNHQRFKLMANYGHRFKINSTSYFSLGATPGIDVLQADYTKATTDFENDPILSYSNQSLVSFNMGFGALYYNKKFWAGLSIPSFFNSYFDGADANKTSLSFREMTYQLNVGWKTDVGKLFTFQPSGMFRIQHGSPLQFDINALMVYRERLGLGLSYRSASTINILANVRLNKDFKLGYAFATQLGSEITKFNSGTHEVALIYGLGNNRTANLNLPQKIKQYKKKKAKEIKKAIKDSEKNRKKDEKARKKKGEQGPAEGQRQPYF